MYCRHCGKEMNDQNAFCPYCGGKVKSEERYCPNCGAKVDPYANVCPACGFQIPPIQNVVHRRKSKMAAGLLGIFLGALGVHNFYLGFTSKGVIQVAMVFGGILTCGLSSAAAGIWGFVEGILILTGSIHEDADGNELYD